MYEKEGILHEAALSDATSGDPISEACAQPLPESIGPVQDGNAEAKAPPPFEAPSGEDGGAALQEDAPSSASSESDFTSSNEAEAQIESNFTSSNAAQAKTESDVTSSNAAEDQAETAMGEGKTDPSSPDGADEEAMEAPALFADPLPSPDPDPGIPPAEDPTGRLDALRGELTRMEQRLQMQEKRFAALGRECEEFNALYPEIPLSSLPESVWEATRQGIPLAAAYALEERRRIRSEEKARESNLRNRQRSTGELRPAANDFFSPAEVRAMSTAEVRANYQSIMRSMQKWH